jgi:hypothetical protein
MPDVMPAFLEAAVQHLEAMRYCPKAPYRVQFHAGFTRLYYNWAQNLRPVADVVDDGEEVPHSTELCG